MDLVNFQEMINIKCDELNEFLHDFSANRNYNKDGILDFIDKIYHLRHDCYVSMISFKLNIPPDETSFMSLLRGNLDESEFSKFYDRTTAIKKIDLSKTPDLCLRRSEGNRQLLEVIEVSVTADRKLSLEKKSAKYSPIISYANELLEELNINTEFLLTILNFGVNINSNKKILKTELGFKEIDFSNSHVTDCFLLLETVEELLHRFYNTLNLMPIEDKLKIEKIISEKFQFEVNNFPIKLNEDKLKFIIDKNETAIQYDNRFKKDIDITAEIEAAIEMFEEAECEFPTRLKKPEKGNVMSLMNLVRLKMTYLYKTLEDDNASPSFHFNFCEGDLGETCEFSESYLYLRNLLRGSKIIDGGSLKNNIKLKHSDENLKLLRDIFTNKLGKDDEDLFFEGKIPKDYSDLSENVKKNQRFNGTRKVIEKYILNYKVLTKESRDYLKTRGIFGKILKNKENKEEILNEMNEMLNVVEERKKSLIEIMSRTENDKMKNTYKKVLEELESIKSNDTRLMKMNTLDINSRSSILRCFKHVKEITDYLCVETDLPNVIKDSSNICDDKIKEKMDEINSKTKLNSKTYRFHRFAKFINQVSTNVLFKSKLAVKGLYILNYKNKNTWVVVLPGMDIYQNSGETRFFTVCVTDLKYGGNNKIDLKEIFNQEIIQSVFTNDNKVITISKMMSLGRSRWEHLNLINPSPFVDMMSMRTGLKPNSENLKTLVYVFFYCSYGCQSKISGIIDHFRYLIPGVLGKYSGVEEYLIDKLNIPVKSWGQYFIFTKLNASLISYFDVIPMSPKFVFKKDRLQIDTAGVEMAINSAFINNYKWSNRDNAFGELFIAFHLTGKNYYNDFSRQLKFMDTVVGGQIKFNEMTKKISEDLKIPIEKSLELCLMGFNRDDYMSNKIYKIDRGPLYCLDNLNAAAYLTSKTLMNHKTQLMGRLTDEKLTENSLVIGTFSSTNSSIDENYKSVTAMELTMNILKENAFDVIESIKNNLKTWLKKIHNVVSMFIRNLMKEYKILGLIKGNLDEILKKIEGYHSIHFEKYKKYIEFKLNVNNNEVNDMDKINKEKMEEPRNLPTTSSDIIDPNKKWSDIVDDDELEMLNLMSKEEIRNISLMSSSITSEQINELNKVKKKKINTTEDLEMKFRLKSLTDVDEFRKILYNGNEKSILDVENFIEVVLGNLNCELSEETIEEFYQNELRPMKEEYFNSIRIIIENSHISESNFHTGTINKFSPLNLSFNLLDAEPKYKVVPKGQRTAEDREIYIQNKTRYSSYVLEHTMRAIASVLPNEAITVSGDEKAIKLRRMEEDAMIWQSKGLKNGKERHLLMITGDMTKWSAYDAESRLHQFSNSLGEYIGDDFISVILRQYSRLNNIKKVQFKDILNAKTNEKNEKNKKESNNDENKKESKAAESILNLFDTIDSKYPNATINQNWLQGMRNYTSSVLHFGSHKLIQQSFLAIDNEELYYDFLVHSDDWVVIIGYTDKKIIGENTVKYEYRKEFLNKENREEMLLKFMHFLLKSMNNNVSIKKTSVSEYIAEFVSYYTTRQSIYMCGEKQLVSMMSEIPNTGTHDDSYAIISKAYSAIAKGMSSDLVDHVMKYTMQEVRHRYSMDEGQRFDPCKFFNVDRRLLPISFFPDLQSSAISMFLFNVDIHDWIVFKYLYRKLKECDMSEKEYNSLKLFIACSFIFNEENDLIELTKKKKIFLTKGFTFQIPELKEKKNENENEEDDKLLNEHISKEIEKELINIHKLFDTTFELIPPTDNYGSFLTTLEKMNDKNMRFSLLNKNKTVYMRLRSKMFTQKCLKLPGLPGSFSIEDYFKIIGSNMSSINDENIEGMCKMIIDRATGSLNESTINYDVVMRNIRITDTYNRTKHQRNIIKFDVSNDGLIFNNDIRFLLNYIFNNERLNLRMKINDRDLSIEKDIKSLEKILTLKNIDTIKKSSPRKTKKYLSEMQKVLVPKKSSKMILSGPNLRYNSDKYDSMIMCLENNSSESLLLKIVKRPFNEIQRFKEEEDGTIEALESDVLLVGQLFKLLQSHRTIYNIRFKNKTLSEFIYDANEIIKKQRRRGYKISFDAMSTITYLRRKVLGSDEVDRIMYRRIKPYYVVEDVDRSDKRHFNSEGFFFANSKDGDQRIIRFDFINANLRFAFCKKDYSRFEEILESLDSFWRHDLIHKKSVNLDENVDHYLTSNYDTKTRRIKYKIEKADMVRYKQLVPHAYIHLIENKNDSEIQLRTSVTEDKNRFRYMIGLTTLCGISDNISRMSKSEFEIIWSVEGKSLLNFEKLIHDDIYSTFVLKKTHKEINGEVSSYLNQLMSSSVCKEGISKGIDKLVELNSTFKVKIVKKLNQMMMDDMESNKEFVMEIAQTLEIKIDDIDEFGGFDVDEWKEDVEIAGDVDFLNDNSSVSSNSDGSNKTTQSSVVSHVKNEFITKPANIDEIEDKWIIEHYSKPSDKALIDWLLTEKYNLEKESNFLIDVFLLMESMSNINDLSRFNEEIDLKKLNDMYLLLDYILRRETVLTETDWLTLNSTMILRRTYRLRDGFSRFNTLIKLFDEIFPKML